MPEQAWISGPGDDSVVAVIGSKGRGDRAAFLVRRQAKAARSRTSRLAALKFQAMQLALPCPFSANLGPVARSDAMGRFGPFVTPGTTELDATLP